MCGHMCACQPVCNVPVCYKKDGLCEALTLVSDSSNVLIEGAVVYFSLFIFLVLSDAATGNAIFEIAKCSLFLLFECCILCECACGMVFV